jgi:recombination protein RecA
LDKTREGNLKYFYKTQVEPVAKEICLFGCCLSLNDLVNCIIVMNKLPPYSKIRNQTVREVISSGSLLLDLTLGIGGIPRGRFIEIFGPPASGKTTLCQHIIAEAQKQGSTCAFVDTDHTLDAQYARRCGVIPKQLYVSDPESAEQALEITQALARSGGLAVIALDSVSTLIPQVELSRQLSTRQEESSHRMLARALRILAPVIRKNNVSIILTHQSCRRKGAIYHKLADNTARLAIKLYSTIRLQLVPCKPILKNGQQIGQRVQINIVKNSLFPCLHSPELDIMYNAGIRKTCEVLDLGIRQAIVTHQGVKYYFKGKHLGNGRKAAAEFLANHPEICLQIEQVIRRRFIPAMIKK